MKAIQGGPSQTNCSQSGASLAGGAIVAPFRWIYASSLTTPQFGKDALYRAILARMFFVMVDNSYSCSLVPSSLSDVSEGGCAKGRSAGRAGAGLNYST